MTTEKRVKTVIGKLVDYVAGKRLVIETLSLPKFDGMAFFLLCLRQVAFPRSHFFLPVNPGRHNRPDAHLSPHPAPNCILMIKYVYEEFKKKFLVLVQQDL